MRVGTEIAEMLSNKKRIEGLLLEIVQWRLYRSDRDISRRKASRASCERVGCTIPASRMLIRGLPSGNTSLPMRIRPFVVCYH